MSEAADTAEQAVAGRIAGTELEAAQSRMLGVFELAGVPDEMEMVVSAVDAGWTEPSRV